MPSLWETPVKFLKFLGYLFCFGCLLAVVLMASGCATAPDDTTHGVLVKSWWVSIDNPPKKDFWVWDAVTHMCEYKDGTIINAGRKPCP